MTDLFANHSLLNLDNGHYICLSAIESFFDYVNLDKELLERKKEDGKVYDFCVTEKGATKKPLAVIITKNEDLILVSIRPFTLATRISSLNSNHYNNLKQIFNPVDDK